MNNPASVYVHVCVYLLNLSPTGRMGYEVNFKLV